MKQPRYASLLAALMFSLGCTDVAKIGELCPVGCQVRSDKICDCTQIFARRDAGASDAGSSTVEDASSAADSGAAMCVSTPALNLVVVLDEGASLLPWWAPVAEGFTAFLKDDAARNLGIGMIRFDENCDPEMYLPPMIPIAPLADNLAALQAATPATATLTNSTIPALDAAERYAQRWSADHPDARVVVVLITDASPGACDGLSGNYEVEAARLAQAAHLTSPFIQTYVVGVGSFDLVDSIARAGGTESQRIPITATGADVLTALRTIVAQASAGIAAAPTCQNQP